MQLQKVDKRIPVKELYSVLDRLDSDYKWLKGSAYKEERLLDRATPYHIDYFLTRKKGPALWIISGVHGEEPAGPNAIARNIDIIGNLGLRIPMVVFPMCNPLGYIKNWRYPNKEKYEQGESNLDVQDADSFVPNQDGTFSPCPQSNEARNLCLSMLQLSKYYPPVLALDLHEDNKSRRGYLYTWSNDLRLQEQVSLQLLNLLSLKVPVYRKKEFQTRFGEKIVKGVIKNPYDGSFDQLLSLSSVYNLQGKKIKGPNANLVVVIETPSLEMPLERRVLAHEEVIKSLDNLASVSKIFQISEDYCFTTRILP